MKSKQYIGVTGITTVEHVKNMNNALGDHLGMYGILKSMKRLYQHEPEGRWAGIDTIPELLKEMPEDSLRTLHWCAPDIDIYYINRVLDEGEGLYNAIQLNMAYPSIEGIASLKRLQEDIKVIFQIEDCMFGEIQEMERRIKPYVNSIDYAIIDQSMGAGKPIDPKTSRGVAVMLKRLKIDVVFAGGLTDKKVGEISDLIREFDGSIDAEGNLMNEEGKLSHIKVRNYIKAGLKAMEK